MGALEKWLKICSWVKIDTSKYQFTKFTYQPATYKQQRNACTNEDVLDLVSLLRNQMEYRRHPLCNMDCILMGWQHGILDISIFLNEEDIIVGGKVELINI